MKSLLIDSSKKKFRENYFLIIKLMFSFIDFKGGTIFSFFSFIIILIHLHFFQEFSRAALWLISSFHPKTNSFMYIDVGGCLSEMEKFRGQVIN